MLGWQAWEALLIILMKTQSKSILVNNHPSRRNIGKGNLTPTKNQLLMGVTFSKKASIRTLHHPTRQQAKYSRLTHHSIEELHHSKSVENAEHEKEAELKDEGDGLFSRSYAKIQRMKGTMASKSIGDELNDILVLIEEEKGKIRESLKKLQQCNQYYRGICEGRRVVTVDTAINTEEFISDGMEAELTDRAVQCSQGEVKEECKVQSKQSKKVKQAYNKLNTMLIDMNINPLQILPQESASPDKIERSFKALSDGQKIKIQQFFIKKLAAKLAK